VQAEYCAPKSGYSWVPTRSSHAEGNSEGAATARRPRTWRGRRPLACAKTLCAEPGRPCIWPGDVLPGPHGAPDGHDRDGRVQGVGQLQSTDEAFEQGSPHGTSGAGGGQGAGQGDRGGAHQEPDTAPGSPVTCAQPRTYDRHLRVPVRYDPRQEPGAVVPHAGICAGGAG